MRLHDTRLGQIEAVVAIGTVLLGWIVFADQLRTDGWISGGGTAWLLATVTVASAGATVAISARRAGRHAWTAVGLAAVAVSPTVFLFVLNLMVVALAATELVLAVRHRQHEPTPLG
jgi:hypothetical protein